MIALRSIFVNPEVFDPEYIPEEFLYRESQLRGLSLALKPAVNGSRPVNCLCLGPPATGKTTAVRIILGELGEFEHVVPVYVNCQLVTSKQQVFAKIYEGVFGHKLPSYSTPFVKLYDAILRKIMDEELVLIVALDDLNALLSDIVLNEALYALLKAHEEFYGVKIGIIGVATDVRLAARLDPRVGSVFHPEEIYFPPYDREEMEGILRSRIRAGLYPGAITDEAFQLILDLAQDANDLRFGLYLVKFAGLEAEERGSDRIEVEDVEAVYISGKIAFVEKSLRALDDLERELLKFVYSSDIDAASTLYKKFREKHRVGYTKFNEALYKLEGLRLIDIVHGVSNRRTVLKRFDPQVVMKAFEKSTPSIKS